MGNSGPSHTAVSAKGTPNRNAAPSACRHGNNAGALFASRAFFNTYRAGIHASVRLKSAVTRASSVAGSVVSSACASTGVPMAPNATGAVLPMSESPAAGSGLRAGDMVLAVAGSPLGDAQSLQRLLFEDAIDTRMEITVLRSGALVDVVAVRERPAHRGQRAVERELADDQMTAVDARARGPRHLPRPEPVRQVEGVDGPDRRLLRCRRPGVTARRKSGMVWGRIVTR